MDDWEETRDLIRESAVPSHEPSPNIEIKPPLELFYSFFNSEMINSDRWKYKSLRWINKKHLILLSL
ncbi:unnamed protein product [Blepharisma stoltei]|uniref:Acetyl-CoA carboxylase beta subunit n=1 Tax=Blepharisma stoltei TaxID=1481888 RepID=A0AAU9IFC7_9CILI|nr:unnamed protein product [Blepharisma stoltei]